MAFRVRLDGATLNLEISITYKVKLFVWTTTIHVYQDLNKEEIKKTNEFSNSSFHTVISNPIQIGKSFPHYHVCRSSYIPVNNSVTCAHKFLFIYMY